MFRCNNSELEDAVEEKRNRIVTNPSCETFYNIDIPQQQINDEIKIENNGEEENNIKDCQHDCFEIKQIEPSKRFEEEEAINLEENECDEKVYRVSQKKWYISFKWL